MTSSISHRPRVIRSQEGRDPRILSKHVLETGIWDFLNEKNEKEI